jgi:hypothetical protein
MVIASARENKKDLHAQARSEKTESAHRLKSARRLRQSEPGGTALQTEGWGD